jgi:dihydroxyacetone kinase-like protein
MSKILTDLPYKPGDEVAVMINGLGATPIMEQFIMNNKVNKILKEKGIKVHRTYIGEYMTSLEMAGASITLLKLDEELKNLLDAPADTPAFRQF